jgi:hypothetical protein
MCEAFREAGERLASSTIQDAIGNTCHTNAQNFIAKSNFLQHDSSVDRKRALSVHMMLERHHT